MALNEYVDWVDEIKASIWAERSLDQNQNNNSSAKKDIIVFWGQNTGVLKI